jgi:hypothetical protein
MMARFTISGGNFRLSPMSHILAVSLHLKDLIILPIACHFAFCAGFSAKLPVCLDFTTQAY